MVTWSEKQNADASLLSITKKKFKKKTISDPKNINLWCGSMFLEQNIIKQIENILNFQQLVGRTFLK